MGHISRVLYKSELNLETALHIGCSEESPAGAVDIIRNGSGEFIMPGTSIAGVFFDTLQTLLKLEEQNGDKSFLLGRCNLDNNTIYLVPKRKEYLIKKLNPRNVSSTFGHFSRHTPFFLKESDF